MHLSLVPRHHNPQADWQQHEFRQHGFAQSVLWRWHGDERSDGFWHDEWRHNEHDNVVDTIGQHGDEYHGDAGQYGNGHGLRVGEFYGYWAVAGMCKPDRNVHDDAYEQ